MLDELEASLSVELADESESTAVPVLVALEQSFSGTAAAELGAIISEKLQGSRAKKFLAKLGPALDSALGADSRSPCGRFLSKLLFEHLKPDKANSTSSTAEWVVAHLCDTSAHPEKLMVCLLEAITTGESERDVRLRAASVARLVEYCCAEHPVVVSSSVEIMASSMFQTSEARLEAKKLVCALCLLVVAPTFLRLSLPSILSVLNARTVEMGTSEVTKPTGDCEDRHALDMVQAACLEAFGVMLETRLDLIVPTLPEMLLLVKRLSSGTASHSEFMSGVQRVILQAIIRSIQNHDTKGGLEGEDRQQAYQQLGFRRLLSFVGVEPTSVPLQISCTNHEAGALGQIVLETLWSAAPLLMGELLKDEDAMSNPATRCPNVVRCLVELLSSKGTPQQVSSILRMVTTPPYLDGAIGIEDRARLFWILLALAKDKREVGLAWARELVVTLEKSDEKNMVATLEFLSMLLKSAPVSGKGATIEADHLHDRVGDTLARYMHRLVRLCAGTSLSTTLLLLRFMSTILSTSRGSQSIASIRLLASDCLSVLRMLAATLHEFRCQAEDQCILQTSTVDGVDTSEGRKSCEDSEALCMRGIAYVKQLVVNIACTSTQAAIEVIDLMLPTFQPGSNEHEIPPDDLVQRPLGINVDSTLAVERKSLFEAFRELRAPTPQEQREGEETLDTARKSIVEEEVALLVKRKFSSRESFKVEWEPDMQKQRHWRARRGDAAWISAAVLLKDHSEKAEARSQSARLSPSLRKTQDTENVNLASSVIELEEVDIICQILALEQTRSSPCWSVVDIGYISSQLFEVILGRLPGELLSPQRQIGQGVIYYSRDSREAMLRYMGSPALKKLLEILATASSPSKHILKADVCMRNRQSCLCILNACVSVALPFWRTEGVSRRVSHSSGAPLWDATKWILAFAGMCQVLPKMMIACAPIMGVLPGDQLSILLQMTHARIQQLREADAEGDGINPENVEQGRIAENQEFDQAIEALLQSNLEHVAPYVGLLRSA